MPRNAFAFVSEKHLRSLRQSLHFASQRLLTYIERFVSVQRDLSRRFKPLNFALKDKMPENKNTFYLIRDFEL